MPGEKAIYYPSAEADVMPYYHNAVTQLAGGLATKYGISFDTMLELQTNDINLTHAFQLAISKNNIAESSTREKDIDMAKAKLDLLNELDRIQRLPNFEEPDAELLGIRRFRRKESLRKVKPVITAVTVLDERVIIDWFRGDMEGVIVYGSYNNKNYAEIGRDMRSPFEDLRLNRTIEPEERYYKFRYMKDDKPVGLLTNAIKVVAQILTPYVEPVPPTEIIATIAAPVYYEIGMSGNADKSVTIDFGGGHTVTMIFDGVSTNFENYDFTETGTKQVKVSGNVIDILEYHSNNSHVTDLYLPDDARNINTLVLQNNNLSTAAVDYILIRMNGFNTVGKVINLIGNASPSAAGLAAKAALEARGWIVLIS